MLDMRRVRLVADSVPAAMLVGPPATRQRVGGHASGS